MWYPMDSNIRERTEELNPMAEWDFAQWSRFLITTAIIFMIVGGIVSQTTEGASARGFMEGMWKGIEWFLIGVIGIGIVIAAWYGIMTLASSMNQ